MTKKRLSTLEEIRECSPRENPGYAYELKQALHATSNCHRNIRIVLMCCSIYMLHDVAVKLNHVLRCGVVFAEFN